MVPSGNDYDDDDVPLVAPPRPPSVRMPRPQGNGDTSLPPALRDVWKAKKALSLVIGIGVAGIMAAVGADTHFATADRLRATDERMLSLTKKFEERAEAQAQLLSELRAQVNSLNGMNNRLDHIEDQMFELARTVGAPIVIRRHP